MAASVDCFDERRARAAQIAFVSSSREVVESPRDREVQERIAEVFEALVVVPRGAAVRERALEQRGIFERVAKLFLGPAAARAHRLISTCLSKTISSQMSADVRRAVLVCDAHRVAVLALRDLDVVVSAG